jgi:hypothetical protein
LLFSTNSPPLTPPSAPIANHSRDSVRPLGDPQTGLPCRLQQQSETYSSDLYDPSPISDAKDLLSLLIWLAFVSFLIFGDLV